MANSVTIKSYRVEREKEILKDLESNMARVGQIVENQAKLNVSKIGNEHPQVQTGQLRSSITHEVEKTQDDIVTIIGTNVVHGKYLELGTVKMPPYAWLFPAVEMKKTQISEAINGRGFEVSQE